MVSGQQRQGSGPPGAVVAYVGTYSSAQGPNRGQGIHILEMNPSASRDSLTNWVRKFPAVFFASSVRWNQSRPTRFRLDEVVGLNSALG